MRETPARARAVYYSRAAMILTLPWHLKGAILAVDAAAYMLSQPPAAGPAAPEGAPAPGPAPAGPQPASGMRGKSPAEVAMYATMMRIGALYLVGVCVLLSPSLLASVKNREKTNVAVAHVLSLLSSFVCVALAATDNVVSVEHACYCLQFCLSYASFWMWHAAASDRLLFAGNRHVKHVSAAAAYLFPLVFSQALSNGMHLSKYIIPITFSGEIAGVYSIVATAALSAFIQLVS